MGLYLENGFVNIEYCLNFKCPLTFIIGGRGTGKTFGALKYCIENNQVFMLLRRQQTQTDLINKKEFSPINPVARYLNMDIITSTISKYNSAIIKNPDSENIVIGYTGALTTFSNLRGFSGDDIKLLLYDEFIPEKHERNIKHEADAFLNCYESINRNRELNGEKPLVALLLSNSNSIVNPILEYLNLTTIIEKMKTKKQEEYINTNNGIAIFLLNDSPISQLKRKTALYKMTTNTDFSEMSLSNNFIYDDFTNVKSLSLNSGWKLKIVIGEIGIYTKGSLWYVSKHIAGTALYIYGNNDIEKKRFILDFPFVYKKILNNSIYFENIEIKTAFVDMFMG